MQRGFDAEKLVGAFDVLRHQHPDGPALFHSRLRTHGERSIRNCHPFSIGGDSRTVLAHNGILPKVVQPTTCDWRSDTRIMTDDFLPAFGALRTRRNRLRLQRWMTPRNMAVILTVDRRFRRRAYILNEETGIWDGRIWYSNDGYLPATGWTVSDDHQPGGWLWDIVDSPPDVCGWCQDPIDLAMVACAQCGCCPDCAEPAENCLCYRPAVLDQASAAPQGWYRTR